VRMCLYEGMESRIMAGKKPTQKANHSRQKMSTEKRMDRVEQARKREEAQKAAAERKQRARKIAIVVICVILVLALGVPTVALSFLSGSGAA